MTFVPEFKERTNLRVALAMTKEWDEDEQIGGQETSYEHVLYLLRVELRIVLSRVWYIEEVVAYPDGVYNQDGEHNQIYTADLLLEVSPPDILVQDA